MATKQNKENRAGWAFKYLLPGPEDLPLKETSTNF